LTSRIKLPEKGLGTNVGHPQYINRELRDFKPYKLSFLKGLN
jgi:hypothetical protein